MPKKILLADDSITIQKVVELTFSDGDYEVIATNNGNKAIQKLGEVRPDIILSDIIMPEKNGYELCEYVKSHPDYRHIPVILLTGTFEPFDPDRAEKAGCDAVITKPFESQSLIHKVEELIQQGSAGAEGSAPPSKPAATREPSSFVPPPQAETRAFPPPKLDMGWPAPATAAPSPTPREAGSFSAAPETTATQPVTPIPGTTKPSPTPSKSAFEEHGEDFKESTETSSEPEEPEIYGGATKAFPKMSFEDLQRLSAAPEPAAPETAWEPPEEAAPASEWAAPGAPSFSSASEAPFGGETLPPPSTESESIFETPEPVSAPAWPSSPPVSPPATPARAAESLPAARLGEELTDEQVDRIARRVIELMSDQVVRNIAWEVIPDLAEMVVRERIRQLESES